MLSASRLAPLGIALALAMTYACSSDDTSETAGSGGQTASTTASTSSAGGANASSANTGGANAGGATTTTTGAGGAGATHEPPSFTTAIDESWDVAWPSGWWHDDGGTGSVEAGTGELVWTYPAGFSGAGLCPGSRIIREDLDIGPYHYQRLEGLTYSANWEGGPGAVNKIVFWSRASGSAGEIHGYIMAEGTGTEDLEIAVNSQGFPFPGGVVVQRWDDAENLASPTQAEATFERGVPHTLESLMFKGTAGSADGWYQIWLDGVLVMHFDDLPLTPTGEEPDFAGCHLAPFWGGFDETNDVDATQTLRISRAYVSWGTSL